MGCAHACVPEIQARQVLQLCVGLGFPSIVVAIATHPCLVFGPSVSVMQWPMLITPIDTPVTLLWMLPVLCLWQQVLPHTVMRGKKCLSAGLLHFGGLLLLI
jgi:hypothetical protein